MAEGKTHVSIVICGHVDAGKSTTTGRLIYELGGIPEREMEKLRAEADALGKGSFCFAFFMDNQKEERERGVTIACTTKEFFTERYHYTIIDAPGHRDFIKNMITGASQADVALLMVPSNVGGFETSIAKGNHKTGEIQGQTRQHARLINLLGVEQLIVGINKMDDKSVNYAQARYEEIKKEVQGMLVRVGWKQSKVDTEVPFLPISGWHGDNLLKKSTNMDWWTGVDVKTTVGTTVHIDHLLDALNSMVQPPARVGDKPMRMPVSGIYKIKGVGDVITGRLEQGTVKPGDEVVFIPTHTASTPCTGKIFTVEMHHKSCPAANAGDNVGLNVKGLEKANMPHVGDIMILKSDKTLVRTKAFTVQIVVLDHPGQLKVGYTPIAFVRTGRSAVKLSKIVFKMGKSTGQQKVENPPFVENGDMAECEFEPVQPFVVESFKECAGLGRVAIMEGNSVVMLGKVVKVDEQARRLQTNLEQSLLKERILQLLALKNQLIQQTMGKIILESQPQIPSDPYHVLNQHELSNAIPKFSQSPSISENNSHQTSSPISKIIIPKLAKKEKEKKKNIQLKLEIPFEESNKSELRIKLRAIVSFLIKNFGKVTDDLIQLERSKYEQNTQLAQVFDILIRKYSGASKSREEMIKYILRKALRAVKNTIQKKLEVDSKGASTLLCKRYFNENVTLPREENINIQNQILREDDEDDDDILKAMLPFRKNSKNKTMNSNFLAELFSSDQFCKDYDLYLSQVDEILEKDNEKKIGSFLTFLENCLRKNQIETIKNCKRLPWIQLWLEATKNLAFELATTKSWIETRKKVNTGLNANFS